MLRTASTPRYLCRRCSRLARPRSARFYASSTKHDIYDVVCVGGGPAGLSLLTALRSNPVTAGLRVALVEAQDLSKLRAWDLPPGQYSNRCSSLTPSSANFLDSIGAWSYLRRERVQPFHEMQVWDGVSGARIEFDWGTTDATGSPGAAGEHGADGWDASSSSSRTIAYMVENLNLTSALLRRMEELGGVSVFDGARVEDIGYGEKTPEMDLSHWPVISLSSGRQLWARLLVGADGANSPVRTFAGTKSRGWDYERHGVVATLKLGDAQGIKAAMLAHAGGRETAYQRFLPTGPVAALPLPDNHATLVWSTTPEKAAVLKSLTPNDFAAMVNAAFRLSPTDLEYMHTLSAGQSDELAWRLEHTAPMTAAERDNPLAIPLPVVGVQEGTVASFPLRMRHADSYVGERWALVGDAAHTVHPLAGQGLNAGQGDAESLSRALSAAVERGQDLGCCLALEPYETERYAANHVVLGVCDKLHKLYSIEWAPAVAVRSLGLGAVNASRSLKGFLMRQAAGNGFKIL